MTAKELLMHIDNILDEMLDRDEKEERLIELCIDKKQEETEEEYVERLKKILEEVAKEAIARLQKYSASVEWLENILNSI